VAVWPRLTLDWERWTLTHSSAGAVVAVLAVLLFFGLALEVGLAATWTSSVAAVVGVPEFDADGVGPVDPGVDGVAVWRGAVDGVVVWPGALVALCVGGNTVGGSLAVAAWLAGEVGAAVWVADGLVGGLVEGDGEGEGERLGEDDGDGEGVGVADDGSAWHTLFVLADVVLADVVLAGAACAVPSMPRIRKLPLSKVTAATLTCAKRIGIACLRCSSGLPCALRDSEATRGRMGTGTHFRKHTTYASPVLRITARSAQAAADRPV